MELSAEAIRVLGSLMEKSRTTPESYPLTLNSLVLACNQKTSRDPVTDFDEEEVMAALDELREQGLAVRVDMAGSRTAKFRENAGQKWELSHAEYALLAVLFLRGPQTPGQLRQRTERLHAFGELHQVVECLRQMHEREEEPHVLVQEAGRPAGSKEMRYAHTFSPIPEFVEEETNPTTSQGPAVPGTRERLNQMEERLAEVQGHLEAMEARLAKLEELLNDLNS